jgi:hypothetical protein
VRGVDWGDLELVRFRNLVWKGKGAGMFTGEVFECDENGVMKAGDFVMRPCSVRL